MLNEPAARGLVRMVPLGQKRLDLILYEFGNQIELESVEFLFGMFQPVNHVMI